jgi:hypothetical protein
MATANEYAQWIVNNADKKGTSEFETVAKAYELAKQEEQAGQQQQQVPQAAPQQPQPPAEQPSMLQELGRQIGLTGRGAAKSVMSGFGLGTMVADPITSALGMKPTSQALDELLTQVGFPKPKSDLERTVQTGVEVMGSIGGQARAAQAALQGAAGLAPTTGRRITTTLVDDVGQQVTAGTSAAVAGDAISRYAAQEGLDPLEAGGYALAGGLLTGLAAGKGYRALTRPKVPLFTPEMAKNQAREAYTKVSQAGVKVKSAPLVAALDDVQQSLAKAEGGFYPNAIPEHGTVQRLLDDFKIAAQAGDTSFEAIDKMRSNLVTLARESKDPSVRRLLGQVTEGIDLKMSTLQPGDLAGGKGALKDVLSSVRDAREAWRRGAKATILEDALNVAERRGADPKASVGELIRNNFKNIYADKKKMKLFTAEEQKAIGEVVSGKQATESLLSFLARFNPARSQLMAAAAGAGTIANPYLGVPLSVAGWSADKTLAAIQQRAAREVMSKIASGVIPKPQTNTAWRALLEAQIQSTQAAEDVK